MLSLLGAPPAVGEARCDAPPGTAAVEQFCEALPGPDRPRGLGDRSGGPRVTAATVRRLERSRDGQAVLARLVDRNVSEPGTQLSSAREAVPGPGGGQDRRPERTPEEPANNPLGALGSALGPVGLLSVAGTVALLALLLARSRTREAAPRGADRSAQ